jgi:hypothetical protein
MPEPGSIPWPMSRPAFEANVVVAGSVRLSYAEVVPFLGATRKLAPLKRRLRTLLALGSREMSGVAECCQQIQPARFELPDEII